VWSEVFLEKLFVKSVI